MFVAHLEQQPRAPVLIEPRATQQALCVQADRTQPWVERCPHAYGAGVLLGRRPEHLLAPEKGVVERVRLAVAGIAEDGHHLDTCQRRTTQATGKLLRRTNLQMSH